MHAPHLWLHQRRNLSEIPPGLQCNPTFSQPVLVPGAAYVCVYNITQQFLQPEVLPCLFTPFSRYQGSNSVVVKNTGTTLQVNFEAGSNSVSWAGQQLELLQYHFHTPSEHTVEGSHTAMEAHLVHRNTQTGRPARTHTNRLSLLIRRGAYHKGCAWFLCRGQ